MNPKPFMHERWILIFSFEENHSFINGWFLPNEEDECNFPMERAFFRTNFVSFQEVVFYVTTKKPLKTLSALFVLS